MSDRSASASATAATASLSLPRLPRVLPGEGALWLFALDRLGRRLRRGRLTLIRPDGRRRVYGGREPGPDATVLMRSPVTARRLLLGGAVGFGQSFVDGLWDTPDLESVLKLALVNNDHLSIARLGSKGGRLVHALRHRRNANTRAGSRRNIAYHYDLGNTFYGAWLDPSMTYSAALWARPDDSLTEAQANKYRRMCRDLDLKPGQHVLEIGCGWGGFAEVAAGEFGARVTGITLSREQLAYARARMQKAGLADRVAFEFIDYRDVQGRFDAIASIEMFEAVGEAHWPVYFDTLRERLKPGGRAALQVITIDESRFEDYRRGADFIQTYVFPGGMLPTKTHLRAGLTDAGLTVADERAFGPDYGRTLGLWRGAFEAAWPDILASDTGFDERFRRLWLYYLGYCKAGFEHGSIDVVQVRADRPA
ncbi:class I SAM-dependent methyltransferase [Roseospira navarrensis]|uniref:Methyltransferase domain-containing protein n=1 Tax=Roseospira navarrensis TaxID=140058 RepID=A0A7X1ZGQ6_9PROT|nr:cyclopropane-fatty-acyl-phospholipid synthase family protein [Roseospira navarrensis]MQX36915.1 methyltransferase domain-containing protein [Roseospira navarrensis]